LLQRLINEWETQDQLLNNIKKMELLEENKNQLGKIEWVSSKCPKSQEIKTLSYEHV